MTYAEALKEFKANYWRELLTQTGGNVTETARIAGIYRQNIYRSMQRTGRENPVRRKMRGNWGALA
jgi:DNA-binding NtrC family response regulator